jgi:hypothetical protein
MSSSDFQGNIPVSTAKEVFRTSEPGGSGHAEKAVVDKGLPIREEGRFPVESNSEILFRGFPEEFAVKGLVHDAAVDLYGREVNDFRALGVEPSASEINDLLERGIRGSGSASSEMSHRVNQLEKKYDLKPEELLEYEFSSGKTVSNLLEDVAEYRHDNWREDSSEFTGAHTERSETGLRLSGRMDVLYTGERDRILEVKMKDGPDRFDEFQAAAYWMMHGDEDAELVLDYPLADERLMFDPDEDASDFDPESYRFDVTRSRDLAMEAINNLRRLQDRYFETYGSETRMQREKATREALKNLEVA